MADTYRRVVECFLDNLDLKDFRCVILDGSLNNEEHIPGLSDIDLKVFVKGQLIRRETFSAIHTAIQTALSGQQIVFNTWTLLEAEYPQKEETSLFDFVRRYCLLRGSVLYEDCFSCGNINRKEIGPHERDDCIRAVFNFQIRLRRLLTNATAITDVRNPNSDFLLQQSVAYYFHALRYYDAFYGQVCCKIRDTLSSYLKLCGSDYSFASFANEMYALRLDWKNRPSCPDAGKELLYRTTNNLDYLTEKMRNDLDSSYIPVLYL